MSIENGQPEAQRVKVRASVLTGRVYALTEYADDPATGMITADVKHDVTNDVAVIVAEAVAQERERIVTAIEHDRDQWPGATDAYEIGRWDGYRHAISVARTTTEEADHG